jgi:hypothetical protein
MIPVDQIGEMLTAWSDLVRTSRQRQGLPPLADEAGGIAVGQERLADELDAPRIVLVPTGLRDFTNEMRQPATQTLTMADNQPKVLWTAWLGFQAHVWGDEWPGATPKPMWWDFNTAIELFRELAMALYRTCSGPSIRMGEPTFVQPTDQARRGRLLVCEFAVKIPITDEPYVMLQYGAHPKVEIDVTMDPPVDATIAIPS